MKKINILVLVLLTSVLSFSQVGINTSNPDNSSILDIESSDKGVLFPRMTSVERDAIANPANGLIIFNTDENKLQFNIGISTAPIWTSVNNNPSVSTDAGNQLTSGSDNGVYLGRTTHFGKFRITGTGNVTISGLPFEPSQVKFTAYPNVETYDLNNDNQVGNNTGTLANTFGSMTGIATNYSGVISEQLIFVGGSGSSINNISRFASSSHCIGVRYTNNNGNNLGITSASIVSFNADGFTINVDRHADNLVVIFEAYK
ncbi:hypothetical protein [Mesoflavibacter sp.]|uniref:hypothetical protein n=1 Tax=Mesoflavibacter sp. TaxID=1930902 RepID=UPI003515F3B7